MKETIQDALSCLLVGLGILFLLVCEFVLPIVVVVLIIKLMGIL